MRIGSARSKSCIRWITTATVDRGSAGGAFAIGVDVVHTGDRASVHDDLLDAVDWAVVDAAVSGAGGCPYAKGASGNVASEDVVYMLHGLGIGTGIDLDRLAETGRWLATLLGRETGSKAGKALLSR